MKRFRAIVRLEHAGDNCECTRHELGRFCGWRPYVLHNDTIRGCEGALHSTREEALESIAPYVAELEKALGDRFVPSLGVPRPACVGCPDGGEGDTCTEEAARCCAMANGKTAPR
jgi:hypothetical protein